VRPALTAIAVAAASLAAASPAQEVSLSPRNMDFASWIDGRPEAFSNPPRPGYAISRDCEAGRAPGACALRIVGEPGAADFLPLGQSVPPGDSRGHGAVLSGWMRTESVEGAAVLWLRVDGSGGRMLHLGNMKNGAEGARGTSAWRRFEVHVPVAANAERLVFGVYLRGGGTAWFSDLELKADLARVAAARVSHPRPARPVPENVLLPDAQLRLPDDVIPPVAPAWRDEVSRQAKPIRSLVADDFSDLEFLVPLLKDKRVVQLGESGHGVAEFNWLKSRLVRFLHQRLGYDVLAWESSMAGCDVADGMVGTQPPEAVMRACIFAVWHTDETLPLFEYVEKSRRHGKPLTLAGFDTQDSGLAGAEVDTRLTSAARALDVQLAERVAAAHRELRELPVRKPRPNALAAYQELDQRLAKGELPEREWLRRAARSRAAFVRQLAAEGREGTVIRDTGMADNLDALLDGAYPDRKVIVWAHNFHIAKADPDGLRTMGTWVAQRRGPEVFTIGLFMGRGTAAQNSRELYPVAPPPPDTLEGVLAAAGWRMSFVPLDAAAENSWQKQELATRIWGVTRKPLVPARAYDAAIYIDTVTPPAYK
jgi:erythromycin esterase